MERLRLEPEKYIIETELADALSKVDLTSEHAHPHGINQLYQSVERSMLSLNIPRTRIVRKSPLTEISHHYDRLLFPENAGVRSSINSRYVSNALMLRGHTASLVPGELVRFAADEDDCETMLICPGICFRSKKTDRLHASVIHQVDVWYINKEPPLSPVANLEFSQYIAIEVAKALIPDGDFTFAPIPDIKKSHPYMLTGGKLMTPYKESSLSLLEFGVVNSETFMTNGLSEDTNGIAIGVILERPMMIRKELDDVRLIHSNNPDIYLQMSNLDKFQVPEKTFTYDRKISIAVSESTVAGLEVDIENYISNHLDIKTRVSIQDMTSFNNLPESAIKRYGMSEGQVNVVIAIELDFPEEQSKEDINTIRDKIYAYFHKGLNSHLVKS